MEKTDVMWVGQQSEEINIWLKGKEIRQGNRFECLGGTVTGDGKSEAEVRRRIQVGVHVWRKVEGVMADRKKKFEKEVSDVMCNAGLP